MAVTIRKHDVIASNLFFIGMALTVLRLLLYPPSHPDEQLLGLIARVGVTAAFGCLMVAIGLGIRKGKDGMKLAFLFLLMAIIPRFIPYMFVPHFRVPETLLDRYGLSLLANSVFVVAALVLIIDLLIPAPRKDATPTAKS